MKRFGKEGSFFVPLVVFGAIVTLISILSILYIKAERLEGVDNEAIGEKQIKLLTVYQTGEKYLYFVDEAAKLSARPALLEISKNGLNPECDKDSSGQYALWAKQEMSGACEPETKPCYPSELTEQKEKEFFIGSFKPVYASFLEEFNSKKDASSGLPAQIPNDYAGFKVEDSGGNLELVGTAKESIAIEIYKTKAPYNFVLRYKVRPSFRVGIDANFVRDGAAIAATAQALFGKKENEARSIVSSADGVANLDWDEKFKFNTKSSSCPLDKGSCGCCETVDNPCEEKKDSNGNVVCEPVPPSEVPVGDGRAVQGIPYDLFEVPMAVTVNEPGAGDHLKFWVYDDAQKKAVAKELTYNFALSWIEAHPENAAEPVCVCSQGHPCLP